MTSTLHKLGPDAKIYKVIFPDGRQGVAPSIWEAVECATSKAESDYIHNGNPNIFFEEYRTSSIGIKGREAPVTLRANVFEQCCVYDSPKRNILLFEVYRAVSYHAIKSCGHPPKPEQTKKERAKLKKKMRRFMK